MEELLDSLGKSLKPKVNYTALIVWLCVLGAGLLFRSMHWPFGSTFIILSSAAITAFTFSKVLMITKFMNFPLLFLGGTCVIWMIIFLWGAFFNQGHPYNVYGLAMYLIFFVIMFAIHSAINYSLRKKATWT